MRDMTLGQYFPGQSVIHRLDPRAKIILTILLIVALFLAKNVFCFALLTLFCLILILVSGIPIRTVLRGIRPILYVLIFTAILNIFWTRGEGDPLISFWVIRIYREGLYSAGLIALRVLLMIVGSSIFLSYTTSPILLTDALESLLTPLRWLHVPVHMFAMMMSIALRFIPTLIEETEKIMNAQKARGVDFSNGSIVKRAKSLIPILIPLLVSAFKRAGDLATAMECRCYRGGTGRTKLHKLSFGLRDACSLLLTVALLVAVILGNRYIPIGFSL